MGRTAPAPGSGASDARGAFRMPGWCLRGFCCQDHRAVDPLDTAAPCGQVPSTDARAASRGEGGAVLCRRRRARGWRDWRVQMPAAGGRRRHRGDSSGGGGRFHAAASGQERGGGASGGLWPCTRPAPPQASRPMSLGSAARPVAGRVPAAGPVRARPQRGGACPRGRGPSTSEGRCLGGERVLPWPRASRTLDPPPASRAPCPSPAPLAESASPKRLPSVSICSHSLVCRGQPVRSKEKKDRCCR